MMRQEIHDSMKWKRSRRQELKRTLPSVRKFSAEALDAAFEEVELETEIPRSRRVDHGFNSIDRKKESMQMLVQQLATLEAHCQQLERLLVSLGESVPSD